MSKHAEQVKKERLWVNDELARNNLNPDPLWRIDKDSGDLRAAIPLLVDILPRLSTCGAKVDIIHVLTDLSVEPRIFVNEMHRIKSLIEKDAKLPNELLALERSRQEALRSEHEKNTNGYARYGWNVAEAIRSSMKAYIYIEVVEILKDPAYSTARQMLPEALLKVKSKHQETIGLLCDLIDDPDITPNVIDALARAKAIEAIPLIQPYIESPIPLVKREAQKAIKKLEKLHDKPAKPAKPPALTEVTSGPPDGLIESSMNVDAEQIPKFLRKVFKQLQKVDRRVASEVRDALLTMEIDEERTFTFEAIHSDQSSTVYLHLFMDDEDAADLALYAEPDIAAIIDQAMGVDMM
ncbi:MAG: hypothetical protein AAF772_04815 [Acidobacteriota bacterium]